ncbi:MAG: glycosyltransferase 87 family protein, partial [Bdellovibrionota bacterium]
MAHKTDYTDFDVYYRAAVRTQTSQWATVYTLSDGASPFRYMPLTLPLLKPLAQMSLFTAKLTWFFLQVTFFSLGFLFLYRGYIRQTQAPLWTLSLSVLFIFRLCLDTFTIGQVSSLMFLGFSLALYGILKKVPGTAALGLLIPTLFKVAPGFGYFYLLAVRPSRWAKTLMTPLAVVSVLLFALYLLVPDPKFTILTRLWASWASIVAQDSVYYDAAHYGSQSLNSVLLRATNAGFIATEISHWIHGAAAVLICAAIFVFWILRSPINAYSAGLSFSLALFANVWFMPETFKYSLTPLAIPVAFLLSAPKKGLAHSLILGFSFLTISFAGLDLVGSVIFFKIQRLSLPFFATLALGIYSWQQAYKHSVPSVLAKIFGLPRPSMGPWPEFPSMAGTTAASLLIPVLMDSKSRLELSFIKTHVEAARDLLTSRFGGDFEIYVITHGDQAHADDALTQELRLSLSRVSGVKFLYEDHLQGRGAAIRSGFLKSKGKLILFGHLDQPCHPSFYAQAIDLIENEKYEFVRGNRRLAESRFQIPVRVLSLIYKRHKLGLSFNRLVRVFLPVRTTDTHSGHLVMTRNMAVAAFSVQSSPDFLCDLEWY